MEILSFEGSNGSSKRKRGNRFIAIATIAALGFMGSTFAASITLNGNTDVQYGQGITATVACDSSLIITPANTFNGAFNLDSITVLDSSSVTTASGAGLGLCAGKKILVKTLDNSNNVLWSCDVLIGTYVSSVPATAVAGACPSTTTVASAGSGTNKGFSIRNATGTAIAAADVYKITLESHN